MKNILFFGDSNTWGYDADSGNRFPLSIRYTGLLQQMLPANFTLIESGLSGRTTSHEDGYDTWSSGSAYLPLLLKTHDPLDLVVFMLGTNDLKTRLGLTIDEVVRGMRRLIHIAQSADLLELRQQPQVLVISPMPLNGKTLANVPFGEVFDAHAVEKSLRLGAAYEALCTAQTKWCHFFDAAQLGAVTSSDGVHLSPSDHQRLAEVLAQIIPSIV